MSWSDEVEFEVTCHSQFDSTSSDLVSYIFGSIMIIFNSHFVSSSSVH